MYLQCKQSLTHFISILKGKISRISGLSRALAFSKQNVHIVQGIMIGCLLMVMICFAPKEKFENELGSPNVEMVGYFVSRSQLHYTSSQQTPPALQQLVSKCQSHTHSRGSRNLFQREKTRGRRMSRDRLAEDDGTKRKFLANFTIVLLFENPVKSVG